MQVEILDALTDNFMYLIVDVATNTAAAVDPADAEVAVAAAARLGATITHVLPRAGSYQPTSRTTSRTDQPSRTEEDSR